jgi:hypothetical protein
VGSWCVSSWDSDRSVRNTAKRCWDNLVVLPASVVSEERTSIGGIGLIEHAESILLFARSLILLPIFVPSLDPLTDSTEEDPSLLRTQALLTLSYLLKTLPAPLSDHFSKKSLKLFKAEELWTLVDANGPAILRRAAYELLGSIAERSDHDILGEAEERDADDEDDEDDEDEEDDQDSGVEMVAKYVMQHCWGEEEGWAGVIAFLRSE